MIITDPFNITITEELVRTAREAYDGVTTYPSWCVCCPVARALAPLYPDYEVEVVYDQAAIRNPKSKGGVIMAEIKFPQDLVEFIHAIDDGAPGLKLPITFTLREQPI